MGAKTVITAAAVAHIFAMAMGIWALGYGVGCAVTWVYRIREAA